MPLSDFGLSQSSQVYQVFGTKRKHEWSEIDAIHGDTQMEVSAKRMCPQAAEGGDAMNEMLEINHNSIPLEAAPQQVAVGHTLNMSDQHCHQLPQQQFPNQLVQNNQQGQQVQEIHNQPVQQDQHKPEQHNTMVMDLCDETYSNVQLDKETQSMYSNMDSDCVANLQQYGGGDRSPTSGRVRCYCKPSWEGLFDMRPYVSDYY